MSGSGGIFMNSMTSLKSIKELPFIIVNDGVIVEVSQSFVQMTEYQIEDLVNKNTGDIFNILRVGPDVSYDNINDTADYFLFTKSLKVKFINIELIEGINEKIYIFLEKPNSCISDNFPFANKLCADNYYGIGIFSLPDITLLKANEKFIGFFDEPYNKRENCIGRRVNEFVTGFEGSTSEKIWQNIIATGETYNMDEYMFDRFERGITYWKSSLTPIFENGKPKYCIEMTTDITEEVLHRKKIEEQSKIIKQQKEQLKAIIDNISEDLYVIDKERNYIMLNKAARDRYSSFNFSNSNEYVKRNKLYDLEGNELDYDSTPIARLSRGECIKNETIIVYDPNKRYICVNAQPTFDDYGNLSIGVMLSKDVTSKVLQEREIRNKKERLEAIIDSMPDGLVMGEENSKLTFLNSAAESFFYSSEKISKIGEAVQYNKFYYGVDGEEVPLEDVPGLRVFNKGKYSDYRLTVVHPDRKIYASVNGSPIYDDNGKIKAAVLCIRDISEEVKYEKNLKEQKEQLEAVINSMSDALFIINPDGSYRYHNKRAYDMAYDAEKIQSHGDSILHTKYYDINGKKIDKNEMPRFRVLKGEKIDNLIIKAIRPDATTYLSFNGGPVYDDDGNMVFAIICIRDMTEYVERGLHLEESQLKLLNAKREKIEALQKAMEMKDEFLSLISHEFRTPLNVINTAIQAINYICADELSDKLKKYINIIRQNTFRQLRLVNNLLDITRADAGRIKIHKKNIDIVFLTNSIVESVYAYAFQKGVTVNFVSSIGKKLIGIDDEKYERIILNLLSNAIKFTPEGKTITVKLRSGRGKVCIEVKDEGIGIPKDKINVIFERFGQVDSSLSRQAEGAGIGLSLVTRFVEALDGSIIVKSKEGQGSTFTITLPSDKVIEEVDTSQALDLLDNRLVQTTTVEFSDIYF